MTRGSPREAVSWDLEPLCPRKSPRFDYAAPATVEPALCSVLSQLSMRRSLRHSPLETWRPCARATLTLRARLLPFSQSLFLFNTRIVALPPQSGPLLHCNVHTETHNCVHSQLGTLLPCLARICTCLHTQCDLSIALRPFLHSVLRKFCDACLQSHCTGHTDSSPCLLP